MSGWSAKQKQVLAWVVFFIVPFSGICVDVYVPSLPHMAAALGVMPSLVQLTIPLYSLGVAIGQGVTGPLSDRFGRRTMMLIGSGLQFVCLLGVLHTTSIQCILALRVAQGLCLSMILVPARVVLSDVFSGSEFEKTVSLMGAFWALGPIVAPAIGGYLQYYFNWHAPFYFMLGYDCMVFLLVWRILPETLGRQEPFSLRVLASRYRGLAQDRLVVASMLIGGVLVAYMLLFNVVAPFYVQHVLGYSVVAYGRIALLIGVAWFVGNWVSKSLINVPLITRLSWGLRLLCAQSVIMACCGVLLPSSVVVLVANAMVMVALAGSVFPGVISYVLQRYSHIAGTINAFLFSGMWLVGSFVTTLGSLLKTHSILPMQLGYVVFSVLILSVFQWVYCKAYRRVQQPKTVKGNRLTRCVPSFCVVAQGAKG